MCPATVHHCAKKTIQEYIRQLNKAYYVIFKRKRNKSYNYEMCIKNGSTLSLSKDERIRLQTENSIYKSNICQLIYNNFKRFLPDQPIKKLLNDISELAITRFSSDRRNVPIMIVQAIRKSLSIQSEESKEKPILNAALVNKCLSSFI